RELDELRFAACRGPPAFESDPHGNTDAGESAWDQRHRRSWNHRLHTGRGECGGRCAGAFWRHAYRYASHAAKNLALVPRKESGGFEGKKMIPAAFDYIAPQNIDDALRALATHGEEAKLLAGGHSLLPLLKLRLVSPKLLIDLSKVP